MQRLTRPLRILTVLAVALALVGIPATASAQCPPPPAETREATRLWARAPMVVAYDTKATVKGSLKTCDGDALVGKTVELQISPNGWQWTSAGTTPTVAAGAYTLDSPNLTRTRYVRVKFAGDTDYAPSRSMVLRIWPKVSLSAPEAPESVEKGVAFKVSGYLKPKHTAGTYPVMIVAYHWETMNGTSKWVPRRMVWAKASDFETYTKYEATLRLWTAGSWALRAYHAPDWANAATWSTLTKVAVK